MVYYKTYKKKQKHLKYVLKKKQYVDCEYGRKGIHHKRKKKKLSGAIGNRQKSADRREEEMKPARKSVLEIVCQSIGM